MERELKKLQGDYAVLRDKFSLISSVLCSKKVETKTGEYLKSFQKLLNEDFAEKFSAKEDTMTSDAMALLKLQEVEKELTEIVKRTSKDVNIFNINNVDTLQEVIEYCDIH